MDSGAEEMSACRDSLMALLDYLVEPLLPSKSKLKEDISLSDQELVAKQVHAVVLLYNYYHRKQNPGLAFLEFQSFCKLAVDMKPRMQLYFKVVQKTHNTELEVQDKDFSVVEKAIMSACSTCKSLDALNNNPIIDGWPITKVAVFLVDSKKENCVLFHSSITQGVWSVIEKEVIDANQGSETLTKACANKKNRVSKRMDAATLHQRAYLAVKETCGINHADLKILDNHSVYSTSKPKTTVRFYIMQFTQTNEDLNLVPISDVMDSLQGSLVDKECVTPVVEYFHLLPFVDKVLDWLKSGREMSQDSSQHFEVAEEECNSSMPSTEQSPDHSEAVKNIHSGSHSREEVLPSNTFPDSGEPNLNISESVEATEDINGTTCHLKEDSVAIAPNNHEASEARNGNNNHLEEDSDAVAPKPCEASEARNGNSLDLKEDSVAVAPNNREAPKARNVNNNHLEEDSDAVAPKHCEAPEAKNGNSHHLKAESDAFSPKRREASEARNGNSQNIKEESDAVTPKHCEASEAGNVNSVELFPNASQPLAEQVDSRNARTSYLNEESRSCNAQHPESEKGVPDLSIYPRKEHTTEPVVYKKRNRSQKTSSTNKIPCTKTSNVLADDPKQKAEHRGANGSSNGMDINGKESHFPCDDIDRNLNLMLSAQETDQEAVNGRAIVEAEDPDVCSKDCDLENALSNHQIDTATSDDIGNQGLPVGSDFEHLQKMQQTIVSMDPLVSKTALQVLSRKREQLCQKLRSIADEIALCEGNIQTILRGGGDHLAVKLEALVNGCNERSPQTVGGAREDTTQQYNYQDLTPVAKRRRLSEASLSVLSPCQELDCICSKNLWMLPTYMISTLQGGFQAIANVKGVDFDCSSEGATCTTPVEARNSAASKVLAKLRSMAAMP